LFSVQADDTHDYMKTSFCVCVLSEVVTRQLLTYMTYHLLLQRHYFTIYMS